MAIRINPIDLNPDIAIGIAVPLMQEVGAIFNLNYLTIDQAYSNAKNLLLTEKGERIMQPNFGCSLRSLLFENLTTETQTLTETNITENFKFWLPYININRLNVTTKPNEHILQIDMVISLTNNKIDTRSINVTINA